MDVKELSKDQLTELKQAYATEQAYANGEGISYGELVDSETISDEAIFKYYSDTYFVNDDFACSTGQ